MHTIRLASPWLYRSDDQQEWSRVRIPDHREAGALSANYRRTFNRPTGLTSKTRVDLVIEGWLGETLRLSFNGQIIAEVCPELGERLPIRNDISQRMELHNTVEVFLCGGGNELGLLGPVRLEIHEDED